LNCFECSADEHLKVDFESKTVKCKKCAHIGKVDDYEPGDFTKSCLCDSKPSETSGYKRHAETAYLSCLADCKRVDNELEMIRLKKEELVMKKANQERANIKKNKNYRSRLQCTYYNIMLS